MNLRLDGSSWNTDLKAGTDGGVGAMSAAYSPLVGTMIGCEAFYIKAEKGPICMYTAVMSCPALPCPDVR